MIEFEQLSFFDNEKPLFKIKTPIRLIELFAGVGSQAMALRDLGADFEHYRVVEFDKYAIKSYNAIHGTEFPTMDITKIHGSDLGIEDVEKFTYLMTYSFPCQDLSVAGKGKGMAKGDGTRSGLLWEVERLLNEVENLPQVLIMENVPQVHGKKNIADFEEWIKFLKSKGYSNYWQDLNAKNYGVAQNRNRCFMVSILGNYKYEFPEPIELTKNMKDYLEDEVDEKYYIKNEKADKLIRQLIDNGTLENTMLTDRQTDRQTELKYALIKLFQYVFGYIQVRLSDIAMYRSQQMDSSQVNADTYVGVDNLLPNRAGKKESDFVPSAGVLKGYCAGDILIGNIRPYLKKIWYADNDGGTNGDVLVITRNDTSVVNAKYLYYVLSSDSFFLYDMQHSKGAKMPRGDKKAIMEYEFALPKKDIQEKVVDILNRFDTLCHDISSGLPAEIEARKKQYEYYRDKLLDFKEKKG